MIVDRLKNASMYYGIHPRLERALRFLEYMELPTLATGRHEIATDQVFALVQEYDSKPRTQGIWEAHRKYLDVQYVISGAEQIGYAPLEQLQAGEYDEEKDFLKLEGKGDFVELQAGSFMILAPQDAHMPGMAIETPQSVKKVVVKVRL